MQQPIELQKKTSKAVETAWGTWIGRLRETNQDAAAACLSEGVLVVSDGMGGAMAGETAAHMVVHRLPLLVGYHLRCERKGAGEDARAVQQALKDAVMELNHAVRTETSAMQGVGTGGATVVSALVEPGQDLWIVHMGDSRAYVAGDDTLEQLTRDHSVVAALVQQGQLTEDDETALLEHRGKLTRYVGMGGGARAEVNRAEFRPGERLLLCTDGLTEGLDEERIARLLRHPGGPTDACRALLEAAREAGSLDNTTALVAERRA